MTGTEKGWLSAAVQAANGSNSPGFEKTKLYRRLKNARHGVFLWIGTGQHGKTVGVNSFAQERMFWDRDIVLVNYPDWFVWRHYPPRYRAVKWPKDLDKWPKDLKPSKDFIIIDDAAFLIGARDHATSENKNLQKLMTIASHNELFISVTIQNTAMMDFSMMQSQDVYMMHKQMDPMALKFERDEVADLQSIANSQLDHYRMKHPEIHPKAWTYCSTTYEMLISKKPSWWKDTMSKPFYGVIPK